MRISDFSVKEFGALRGVSGVLAPRLTVIWGGNESGKTTLLHFFRRALFVKSASQGEGALLLHMNDGRNLKITLNGRKNSIQEADDPITSGPMTPMGEDFLPLDAETYKRLFLVADSIWDMNARIDFLDADAAFKKSAFSRFTSALGELERGAFSDAESSLYSLWSEIKSNDQQIEGLKNWKAAYWELREALDGKRDTVKNASAALEKKRLALARAESAAAAKPAWLEARELESELTALGPARDLPKRGIERLNSLRERTTDLRRRLDERRRKNAYEASRRRQIENNPVMSLLKYREALEDLERQMARLGDGAETVAISTEIAAVEDAHKRVMMDFAPHWSEGDLDTADLSLLTEQKAHELGNAVEDSKERIRKLRSEMTEEENRQAFIKAEALQANPPQADPLREKGFAARSEPDFSESRARRDMLLDIRRDLLRNDALCWEIHTEKVCASVLEDEINAEGPPPVQRGNYMAKFFLALLLSLSGMLVALGTVTNVFRPYDFYALAFSVLCILVPVFSIYSSRKEHSVRLAQWRARYERRDRELDAIDEKIMEHRREMQAIAISIEQKSQALSIRVPTTLLDLSEPMMLLESGLAAAYPDLEKDKRERLLENLKNCETRLNGMKEKLSGLEDELESALEGWKNWLLQNRFDPNLTPQSFDSFLTAVRGARADLKSLSAMRRRLADIRGYEASIDARIRELRAGTGLVLDKEGLSAVFRSLKEAISLHTRIEASLEERRVSDFECSELERELASAVGSVRTICEEAGADNEETLRAMYEEQAMRGGLEKRLSEARRALASVLPSEDEDAVFGATESSFSAENSESLKLAIAEDEKALREFLDELRTLEFQMDSMVADDSLFTLRQKNETLKVLAQKEFRRWLAVVILRSFAGKALTRHKKNLEPEILRQARLFLSLMAGTNWKIVLDEPDKLDKKGDDGGDSYAAVSLLRESDGLMLGETQWSQGLAEQVGLSMKLAMACRMTELTKNSEPVPIMLDDVLTRFDENRQRGAAEALWQASEKLQVIFFTCHRHTVEVFRSRLADKKGFSVVEMPASSYLNSGSRKNAKHYSRRK